MKTDTTIQLSAVLMVGLLGLVGCSTPCITNTIINEVERTSRIRYVPDRENDYWQSARETEVVWQGDCEDYAIYLRDRLAKKGVKTDLVFGKVNNTDAGYHAWVEMNTKGNRYVLDATKNKIIVNPTRYFNCNESCVFKDKIKAFKERGE